MIGVVGRNATVNDGVTLLNPGAATLRCLSARGFMARFHHQIRGAP